MPCRFPFTRRASPAASVPHARVSALVLALALAACGGSRDNEGAAPAASPTAASAPAADPGGRRQALAAGTAAQGGVIINEVHTANWKGALDEDGDAEDWVELYNPADAEVDLSGYGLSPSTATPFRWAFPDGTKIAARGYVRVWLSKKDRRTAGRALHASFNLDNGDDKLYLSASNATATGILVDSATPPLVRPDHSWCRVPSGAASSPFRICANPTPLAANAGDAFATMLAKPVFSVGSGLYAGAQTVTITGPAGATIRYTTDGTVPGPGSPAYTAPLSVAGSRVVRAASFADGALTSPTESHSYVIDGALAARYAGLKVLFAVMEPADFARYQARDKEMNALVNLELLSAGTRLFKQDIDGSVAGNAGSLDSPQVAMNANARDVFGPKDFVSADVIWPAKPTIRKTKKLRIRNGGNDWAAARLRDQLSQDLGAAGPNIYGAATSVAMFVNGQYYALMDLREREDETIVANNTGADKDWVDFLESPLIPGQEIKNGGPKALADYTTAHNYITGNDMSVAANYAQAQRLIDTQSLAWDWGHHLLLANYDWPNNNVHVFRSPELGNRWTWRPHDFDFALGRYTGADKDMNPSYTAVGSPMFAALLRNPGFRSQFLNFAADQMNLMNPTFMTARLDAMTAEMRPYVNDLYTRNGLGGEAGWNTRVAEVREWIRLREPFHDQQLRTQFGLANRGALAIAINDRAMGTVRVNSLDVGAQMGASGAWAGRYYPGIPLTIEARPKPGYVFVGWQGSSTATTRTITPSIAASGSVPVDNFSARWSGVLQAPAAGSYRFQVIADDSVGLSVNGASLVSLSGPRAESTTTTTAVTLSAGQRVPVVMQYADNGGAATVRLLWQPPGAAAFVPVPASVLYPDAAAPLPTGLFGAYFANASWSGTAVATAVEAVDFAWGATAATPSRAEYRAVFAPGPAPAAPTITAVGAQSARTGDIVNLAITASDANGHTLRYSASGLPKGVGINATTGIVYGRLTTPGSYNATITVSNGVSSGTLPVAFTVTDRPGTGLLGTSPDSGTGGGTPPPPPPPANTAPTVTLTSPTAGQTVAAGTAVTLTANATDADGSVARVEFLIDGNVRSVDSSAPYEFVWSPGAAGSRVITARAVDNLGAATTSAPVTLVVGQDAANRAPTITLTSPTAGQSVVAGTAVTLAATAADSDGSVVRVEFLIDGSVRNVDSAAPYQFVWSPGAAGSRVITARAVDDRGAATTSAAVTLNVTAPVAATNRPPTVSLTAPANNTVVAYNAPLTLRVAAADADGSVARVRYFDGTQLLGTVTTNPFDGTFSLTVPGPHTLTAVATDNAGAETTSAPVSVLVGGPDAVVLPPGTTACANEGGTCTLPAGATATVYYGGRGLYYVRTGRTGSLSCNSATFGDPLPTAAKSCYYLVTGTPPATISGALKAEYWNNTTLSGTPVLTQLEVPDHYLDSNVAPGPGVGAGRFSVRWSGSLTPNETGWHWFGVNTSSGDGVRLWVNGQLLVDTWTAPRTWRDAGLTLTAGRAVAVRIEFYEIDGPSQMRLQWGPPSYAYYGPVPASRLSTAGANPAQGLRGDYFAGMTLSGSPRLTRFEAVNLSLGLASPAPQVPADGFSARWTGWVTAPTTGTYRFQTESDDGVRLMIDGRTVIDNWTPHPATLNTSGDVYLVAGQRVAVRMEYFEEAYDSVASLRWRLPGASSYVTIPLSALTPP